MNSIFSRVSIRKYKDKPVEKEKTEAILRAAMQAPSAVNQQPWEFYVVTSKEKLEALSHVSPYAGMTKNAPAAIVSVYRKDCMIPDYAQIDMSIAMENMWLETDAQGLGRNAREKYKRKREERKNLSHHKKKEKLRI